MTGDALSEPGTCIVYTTDQKYFFPTLVSAMQAREHASLQKADVTILCFGLEERAERVFRSICSSENIILSAFKFSAIENQTAMMARLFLHRLLPEKYTDYLYFDGDVHILDSLDPLLDTEVPDGHFHAANDPITFLLPDSTPQSRDLWGHFHSLGLTPEQSLQYFNSGVLRIKSRGWEDICQQTLSYIRRSRKVSRFPDQDALNVVAMEQRLSMSLTWNYPVFLRHSGVEATIRPRVKHFMSSPKPWHGAFPPWTFEACKPYLDALQRYPALAPFSLSMAVRNRAIYHLQQRGKQIAETVTWGWSQRRGRILRYEDACSRAGTP